MEFLDLANLRLDHLKTYSSEIYYMEYIYKAKCWVKLLGKFILQPDKPSDD
jgi:hypothetical protein